MAYTTYCINCGSDCLLVNFLCLCESTSPLHKGVGRNAVIGAIKDGQREFVEGILQPPCFAALCAAMEADAAGTTVLEAKWTNLMAEIIPLAIEATTLSYVNSRGFDKLAVQFNSINDSGPWLTRLETRIQQKQERLKQFLADNAATYTCYAIDVNDCGVEDIRTEGADFIVVTKYGSGTSGVNRRPSREYPKRLQNPDNYSS